MEDVRSYALHVLQRVFVDHGYAALIMRHNMPLAAVNRPFASELIYGTIRNYTLLEAQWRPYAQAKHVKRKTALILDMSIYQLFFMDKVPDYAVLHAAGQLADPHERGFINALLHKVKDAGLVESMDLSVQYSHPAWLVGLWKAHYGEETMRKILAADQQAPLVYGRINTLLCTKQELEKQYTFVNDVSFLPSGPLQNTQLFQDGKILIQDIHSAYVAPLLQAEPGMRVLDACAAPGTKTQQIAMMMENQGDITACDLYEARCGLIGELMDRTGVTIVHTKTNDASKAGAFAPESFDRILLDVPCSGLGDLSHKPEIRWHTKPEDLDAITAVQYAILEANAPYLKENGRLVYSTCTLNRKENEGQVAGFLKRHPEFEMQFERTWFPYEDGGDGFYAAVLVKKGDRD